jgi:hypothetical protein
LPSVSLAKRITTVGKRNSQAAFRQRSDLLHPAGIQDRDGGGPLQGLCEP